MTTLLNYDDASPEAQAVFDDIKHTRGVPDVNNFWKALAIHPATLKRTWEAVKDVMRPDGALDPVVKEMLYLAVSVSNGCQYCIASHGAGARKAGMTPEMWSEVLAIVALANDTNRIAFGLQVPVDEQFRT